MIHRVGKHLVGSIPMEIEGWYQVSIDGEVVPYVSFCHERSALEYGTKLAERLEKKNES